MDDMWSRVAENLVDRVNGPLKFRFILQPVMASIFAILSGLKDAKAGRPPYFWGLLSNPTQRANMLRDGWKSLRNIFILALALDVIYQFIVERFVYPGETIIVAFLLAVVPYLIVRGLTTRIANIVAWKK
jgi:hypothetical protein